MNTSDFDFLAQLLKDRSGLVVTEAKTYLLETRLRPLAKQEGLDGLDALVAKLRRPGQHSLTELVVDAMTTNESFFFRDDKPFDHLRDKALPALHEARRDRRRLRIWCAAASTGQEPYSIAMLLREAGLTFAGWDIEIVATDISREALGRAEEGVYSQFEVQRGLPVQFLVKYFEREDTKWRVKPELRNMVRFRHLNLLDPFAGLGAFDVVFCRNVLIYFDAETKAQVLDRMARAVAGDGYLYLGGAETAFGITDSFHSLPEHRGVYRPTGDMPLASAAA